MEKNYFVSVNSRVDFCFSSKGYYFGPSREKSDPERYKDWAKFKEEKEYLLYQQTKEEKGFPKRLMNFLDSQFAQNNKPDFYQSITF